MPSWHKKVAPSLGALAIAGTVASLFLLSTPSTSRAQVAPIAPPLVSQGRAPLEAVDLSRRIDAPPPPMAQSTKGSPGRGAAPPGP